MDFITERGGFNSRLDFLTHSIRSFQRQKKLPNFQGMTALDIGPGSISVSIQTLQKCGLNVEAIEGDREIVNNLRKRGLLTEDKIISDSVFTHRFTKQFDLIAALGASLPIKMLVVSVADTLKSGGHLIISTYRDKLKELEQVENASVDANSELYELGYRNGSLYREDSKSDDDNYWLLLLKN